jgi:predicted DNA-binding transcriptional regulator YafY
VLGFARRGNRIVEAIESAIDMELHGGPTRDTRTLPQGTANKPGKSRPKPPPRGEGTRAVLNQAFKSDSPVNITYVDASGWRSQRTLRIHTMAGGYITAHDSKSRGRRRFKVSRVESARIAHQV